MKLPLRLIFVDPTTHRQSFTLQTIQNWFQVLIVFFVVIGSSANAAPMSDRRVALVISVSEYSSLRQLENPINDGRIVGAALQSAGFEVDILQNPADRGAILRRLERFARDATGAEAAVIYFAGHGTENDGTNRLFARDGEIGSGALIDSTSVTGAELMQAVTGARSLRLVVLDACRNLIEIPAKTRSTDGENTVPEFSRSGLGREATPNGVVVLLSTAIGKTATDGVGFDTTSPFAEAFSVAINVPGQTIAQSLSQTAQTVLVRTDHKQSPDQMGILPEPGFVLVPEAGMRGYFAKLGLDSNGVSVFTGGAVDLIAEASADPFDSTAGIDVMFWRQNVLSKRPPLSPEALAEYAHIYIQNYPNGRFIELARSAVKEAERIAATRPNAVFRRVWQEISLGDQGARVSSIAISSDEKWVAVGTALGRLTIYDAINGRPRYVILETGPSISSLLFVSQTNQLIAGHSNGTIRWLDLAREPLSGRVVEAHVTGRVVLRQDPTGARVLSLGADGTILGWPVSGTPERQQLRAPDPKVMPQLRMLGVYKPPVDFVSLPDGEVLLAASHHAFVARLPGGRVVGELQVPFSDVTTIVTAVAVSDNRQVVGVTNNAAGTHVTFFRSSNLVSLCKSSSLPLSGPIVLTQDGMFGLLGRTDNTATFIDTATCQPLLDLVGHRAPIRSIALGNGRRFAVTGGDDGVAKIWRPTSATQ